ncbi:MAG TPA: ubiquinone/menaquinone biosynthesis methyltransferase [Chthoniobacteraceae bacterium]|nr:ubiquinone/menaquinone biosynthesis methyltransferase [Chthoniobacteraceae bacterium]
MQEPRFVQNLFSAIAPRYDLANALLSGGMDRLWRRRVARIVRDWRPERLLDLATGSGDIALALSRSSPETEVIGADFCVPMLAEARRKGFAPVVAADGMALPFGDESFDAVTIAFGLRNMASYPDAVREMRRVVRPGGHLLILDFRIPPAPLRWLYRPYLHHLLPHLAGFLTGEREAYQYLGESIEAFPAGKEMINLLSEAGWQTAAAEPLTGGIVSIYTAQR